MGKPGGGVPRGERVADKMEFGSRGVMTLLFGAQDPACRTRVGSCSHRRPSCAPFWQAETTAGADVAELSPSPARVRVRGRARPRVPHQTRGHPVSAFFC